MKYLLPLVSYVFQDGPWRDTQIRLGYDPREDLQARLYVTFRPSAKAISLVLTGPDVILAVTSGYTSAT
jgi:hypothetical protein